jgi:hypothetical protein
MTHEDDHADLIAALAEETGVSVERARAAFHEEMAQLGATARITDYLSLFASRRARDRLNRTR